MTTPDDDFQDPDPLFTVDETAEWLGTDARSVRRLVRSGRLPAEDFGSGLLLIHQEDIQDYEEARDKARRYPDTGGPDGRLF